MRISDWSSDVCSSDLGGHLEASGFLLDRIRRRLRPRNRQTRKSLCQPRIEESVLDLRAKVLAVSTTRSAVSQPVPAQPPHATSPGQSREQSREQCHFPEARAICTPGCDLRSHRPRSATTGVAAQSATAIRSGMMTPPNKTETWRAQNDSPSTGERKSDV